MPVKLHRCSATWLKIGRHPCWKVQKALDDQGIEYEVVTGPLLLSGLGIGTLASQLGSVTVSAVPDSQSGEVGGVQNTITNLGASIGTALSGAVLIAVLTTTFLGSVATNPTIPKELADRAQVELSAGIPFVSDADLKASLENAGVPPTTSSTIVEENAQSRINGLGTRTASRDFGHLTYTVLRFWDQSHLYQGVD